MEPFAAEAQRNEDRKMKQEAGGKVERARHPDTRHTYRSGKSKLGSTTFDGPSRILPAGPLLRILADADGEASGARTPEDIN